LDSQRCIICGSQKNRVASQLEAPWVDSACVLSASRRQLDARDRTACRTQNATSLRATWSALHAQQRVTHALASKPPQAGPLNSEQLVHRALLLMREVSPDYLRNLVATSDALSWAEQLQGRGGPVGSPMASTTSRGKPTRGKLG
jgi:hypothetical protein